MEAFPAFIPLDGRIVVVAGEGEAAEAKARLFDGSPARLVRVTGAAAANADAYAGAVLAVVAGDEAFATAAAAAARRAGALVNVVDRPALCDFQTPAIVDRGAVTGAIGTAGSAPVLATALRNDLEARWPQGLGRLAGLLRDLQGEIRARLPDALARRRFLRALIDGPAAEAALAGDLDAARALARTALDHPCPAQGEVWRLQAPASIEDLTLGALQRFGRADRVVAGEGIDPALLALARRDAVRTPIASADAAALAGWAEGGETVVVVTRTDAPRPATDAAAGETDR